MSALRVHLHDPSSDLSRSACGFIAVATTDDTGAVTCRVCLRQMRAERESIPDYVDDRWFIEQTVRPLPMANLTRKQAAAWRHVLDGCARLIAESSADTRTDPRNGPRAPFASVSDAFARMVVTRLDGYAQASVGDPERIKRLTGQLGGFAPSSGSMTSRAQGQAELATEAHRALVHAFPRPWDSPPLSVASCHEIVLLRFVGGRTDDEIAGDMLATRDVAVTPGQVRRIARWGFAQAWEWLVLRGLIPTPSGRVIRADDSEGDDVAKKPCTDADLFGWDSIAQYLGVTRSTAQEWARDRGLPIRRFMAGVEARTDEIKVWRDRQTVRPSAA